MEPETTHSSFIRYTNLNGTRSTSPLVGSVNIAAYEKRQLLEYQKTITVNASTYSCAPYKFGYPWPEEAVLQLEEGVLALGRCGNRNSCIVCSSEILAKKRAQIDSAFDSWAFHGGFVHWQTLTHRRSARTWTVEKYKKLNKTWSLLQNSRGFKTASAKAHNPLFVKVIEETLTSWGWFPHIHCCWLFRHEVSQNDREEFLQRVADQWVTASQKINKRLATPSGQSTFLEPLNLSGGKVPEYLTKHGFHEIKFNAQIENPFDAGLSPFEVLKVLFETGDQRLEKFFMDFEKASRGLRRVTKSRHFDGMVWAKREHSYYE